MTDEQKAAIQWVEDGPFQPKDAPVKENKSRLEQLGEDIDSGKVDISRNGSKRLDLSDVDWNKWLLAGGSGLIAHSIASSLADKIRSKRGEKKSLWRDILADIMPIGAGAAGAYGGYVLGDKMKTAGCYEKTAQEATPGKYGPITGSWDKSKQVADADKDENAPWDPKAIGIGAASIPAAAIGLYGGLKNINYLRNTLGAIKADGGQDLDLSKDLDARRYRAARVQNDARTRMLKELSEREVSEAKAQRAAFEAAEAQRRREFDARKAKFDASENNRRREFHEAERRRQQQVTAENSKAFKEYLERVKTVARGNRAMAQSYLDRLPVSALTGKPIQPPKYATPPAKPVKTKFSPGKFVGKELGETFVPREYPGYAPSAELEAMRRQVPPAPKGANTPASLRSRFAANRAVKGGAGILAALGSILAGTVATKSLKDTYDRRDAAQKILGQYGPKEDDTIDFSGLEQLRKSTPSDGSKK
jgi:hypothetical protein